MSKQKIQHVERIKGSKGPATSASSTGGLPTSVLRDSTKRLKILTLVAFSMLTISVLVNFFIAPALGVELPLSVTGFYYPFMGFMAVTTILLFLLTGSKRLNAERLLDIGLIYMILIALAININNSLAQAQPEAAGGVSWTAVWILIYSAIVPSTPRRTAAAAFIAASTWLPAYGLMFALGRGMPPFEAMLVASVPIYMLSGVAVVPALIIHRLGRQVKDAQEMGAYRLESLLGKGGMGEVWLARHNMLARPAALKLIRPEMLGDAGAEGAEIALQRFEREAQATAALTSPNTVEIFDFGVTEVGTFYYVMELLNGVDLASLVEKHGPIPAERASYLLQQACHSLADAHQNGLIHRDIKPANLYVCRMGIEVDIVKVLDFGLVKSKDRKERAGVQLTSENVVTGTPAFLPPETATGELDASPQSDIYALGCVAYWLVTGKFVFEGDNPMSIIVKHIREEPIAPSRQTELNIPADLDRIILDCLQKSPDDRPSSALELGRRLSAMRTDQEWTDERAQEWWRTHLPVDASENRTTSVRASKLASPEGETILQTRI